MFVIFQMINWSKDDNYTDVNSIAELSPPPLQMAAIPLSPLRK